MAISFYWILRLSVVLTLQRCVFLTSIKCSRGTFLYSSDDGQQGVCLDCRSETFMPVEEHTYRLCFNCDQFVDPDVEILKSRCNKTHDAEIHCIDGYYRTNRIRPGNERQCQRCTKCTSATVRACQKFRDTVCASSNANENIDTEPWCVRNEFFYPPTNSCMPCPSDTIMDQDRHTNTQCIPQPQSNKPSTGVCVPCHLCPEETDNKRYDIIHHSRDLPCYLQPDTTMVNSCDCPKRVDVPATSTEQRNSPKLRSCGEGEYLSINENTFFATCQPCPVGTYMDETNHTKRLCLNCAGDFKFQHCMGTPVFIVGTVMFVCALGMELVAIVIIIILLKTRRSRTVRPDVTTRSPGIRRAPLEIDGYLQPIACNTDNRIGIDNALQPIINRIDSRIGADHYIQPIAENTDDSAQSAHPRMVVSENSSQSDHFYEIVD